jgi:hypothetical protein
VINPFLAPTCSGCGAELPTSVRNGGACPSCGAVYAPPAPEVAPPEPVVGARSWGGLGVVAVMLGIAIGTVRPPSSPAPLHLRGFEMPALPPPVIEPILPPDFHIDLSSKCTASPEICASMQATAQRKLSEAAEAIRNPAKEAPPDIRFTASNTRPGVDGAIWMYGELESHAEVDVRSPKVVAVFLDASGAEVGVANGYPPFDVIHPGEHLPVAVLATEPPEHSSVRYEVSAQVGMWMPTLAPGLTVTHAPVRRASFGQGWEVDGSVLNGGASAARFVKLVVIGRGEDDRVLTFEDTFADPHTIPPGGRSRFHARVLQVKPEPARWEIRVAGQVDAGE